MLSIFFGLFKKKIPIILLLIVILTSCYSKRSSIDLLTSLNKTSDTIDYLDLSNKKIRVIPNMSKIKVKKLNLSNNKIVKLNFNDLPRGLEELNLSNNRITGELVFEYELNDTIVHGKFISKVSKSRLEKVNLSFNRIKKIKLPYAYENLNLDLSNNKIYNLNIYSWAENRMDTLVLTNNKIEYKPNSLIGSRMNYIFKTVIDD